MSPLRDQIETGLRSAVGELLPSRSVATAVPRMAETLLAQYPDQAIVAPDMQASVVAPFELEAVTGQSGGHGSAILSLEPESALTWLSWCGRGDAADPAVVLERFREEGTRLLGSLLGGAVLPECASVREEGLVATVLGTHAPGSTRVTSAALHIVGEDDAVTAILTLLSDPKGPLAVDH